ncbi:Zinc finger protein [Nesidiocoris tenuis]|uniref:Zinc finger protein n=1 Tax=Nesidiocoris tenuis TaxID=355587 RepID=A0ABN7AV89_9HEMI|nr:Zinc finger protein [Nesidiocoris tenuis]
MERESNSMQALCRSGCGFYGNPSTDGLCSLCYKEALKKKQQPPQGAAPFGTSGPAPCAMDTAVPTIPIIQPPLQESKDCESTEGAVGGGPAALATADSPDLTKDADPDSKDDSKNKKKNRCAVCRKKVGLTGFECRCGGLYCSTHRYSDKHDCTFNYRELGAQEIRRNNPVVVGEKIHKI